jgi:hypothetical protein
MSMKLSNAELELMSAAARRDDRCFEPPLGSKVDRLQKIAEKLTAAALAREIRAKEGLPFWRLDKVTGKSVVLKLTPAGAKAVIPGTESRSQDASAPARKTRGAALSSEEIPISAEGAVEATSVTKEAAPPTSRATIGPTTSLAPPREGTKISNVLELLQRDQGATLDEVIAATGWLPHTSRAALTGLRKRGYGISRRARTEGGFAYAISVAQSAWSQ